jgi:predicted RNase H-like HicB family nuclease
MRYPIAIESGDARHAYGVVVPDLPGCFSAGDTLDDALTNAQEAVLLHLEGLLDDGKPVPTPSDVAQLRRKRGFRNWTWAVVDVDMSQLGDKAARINITLPQRILRAVDAHAVGRARAVQGSLRVQRLRQCASGPDRSAMSKAVYSLQAA